MDVMNVLEIYDKLRAHFGRQYWWPAETPFEVIVGAILTQQTAWKNVEKAIINLKKLDLMTPEVIAASNLETLEKAVYTSGFYRQKALRLKKISEYLVKNYNGNLSRFFSRDTMEVRKELLGLDGVGFETADSILLYAGCKRIFVIDAYTKRMCRCMKPGGSEVHDGYENLRHFFENNLPEDIELYKEYHALIVELGKNYCKTKPDCEKCPLRRIAKL